MKSIVICFAVALLLIPAATAYAEWKGKETTEDGVLHVKNPEEAAAEVRFELSPLWERGGEDDEDVLLGQPTQLLHDAEGNLYVLDTQLSEIHVFSPGGDYLRTIGGQGEGPGEFQAAMGMYMGPDGMLGIVRIFPGRIYRLGTDGSPAENFALPGAAGGGFQLVYSGQANAEHIVVAGAVQTSQGGKQIQTSYLKAFDTSGKELALYHEEVQETQFGGMKFVEREFSNFAQRWAMCGDGRVAVAIDFDTYSIHIWNADGTLDRVIERPQYAALERDGKTKTRFQKLFDGITRWNPNSTFEVSDTHSAVAQMWFRDDGSLWVLSGRGSWERDEGVFANIDEYDRDGRFVKRIVLLGEGDPVEDGLFIEDDRLYRVTNLFSSFMASLGGDTEGAEELADPLRIVAYRLDMPGVGMK